MHEHVGNAFMSLSAASAEAGMNVDQHIEAAKVSLAAALDQL